MRLNIDLRRLESVPLAERLRRNSDSHDQLEFNSAEAMAAAVQIDGVFAIRRLPVLDSPELAARLIQDSSGQVLPSPY